MTRQLLAMLGCYTLGLVAGSADKTVGTSQQVPAVVTTPVATTPVVIAKPEPVVVKTPLVESLRLPPKSLEKPSETPKTTVLTTTPLDGQLSPRGEWQWSQAQGAWVPVARSGPLWRENGHSATVDHLVRDHGYKRADLVRLTQSQLDVLHSNAHNATRRVSAPTYSSSCPSGRCPRR